MILLAFDIGLKRTGVASGQSQMKAAKPAGLLNVRDGRHDWPQVDKLIEQWQPNKIIIGDPKTDNPHLNKAINRFISHIQQQHKLPVCRVDETLSSVAANQELIGRSEKDKIQLRDQIAACLILESYFNCPD